jgi:hypothetical protein
MHNPTKRKIFLPFCKNLNCDRSTFPPQTEKKYSIDKQVPTLTRQAVNKEKKKRPGA